MDMILFISLLSILLFLLIIFHIRALCHRRNLPPGPRGLPIFGNLFDIGPRPHESLANLAKVHGPLMTIKQGNVTSVVVSSPEMARQVLQKQDEAFSGRVVPNAITELEHSSHAVAWLPIGEEWRLIRRVLGSCLINSKTLDMLRGIRQDVVQEMVHHVREVCTKGGTVGINRTAFTTIMNMMSRTCFSANVDEYELGNENGFRNAVTSIMKLTAKFDIADYFPCVKCMDPQRARQNAKAAYGCLEQLCDHFIDQRQKQRNSGLTRHGDILDALLDFSLENQSDFYLKHIQVLLVELFLAGTDTSTITTEWALAELISHPQMMLKLRDEICETVRKEGTIEETEILRLPYLQAVVKETMRLHLAVPFLVPHKTEKDVKINDYILPKNTQVLVNAWAIARDSNTWDKPACFMPERFLQNEIEFKGQHFSFLPFGSGRRMCPGMPLAHRVVSLMIASLVYHFEWKLPNGSTEPVDMSETFSLTLQKAKPLVAVPKMARP
ncbi:cytochrome P450 76T24-like [Apium graveolens]|uniref:cytochrome P450 76T24-like n=1 Tax=Apium graveolens TaxID=4045 RepID=UPI003D7A9FAF